MLSVEDDGIETNASKTIGTSNDDDDENTRRVINHEELVTQMTTTKITNLKMTKIRTVTTRKKVRKIILRSMLMKKGDILNTDDQHHRDIHYFSKKPRETDWKEKNHVKC